MNYKFYVFVYFKVLHLTDLPYLMFWNLYDVIQLIQLQVLHMFILKSNFKLLLGTIDTKQ